MKFPIFSSLIPPCNSTDLHSSGQFEILIGHLVESLEVLDCAVHLHSVTSNREEKLAVVLLGSEKGLVEQVEVLLGGGLIGQSDEIHEARLSDFEPALVAVEYEVLSEPPAMKVNHSI